MNIRKYKWERKSLVEAAEKFLVISNHAKKMIEERFPDLLDIWVTIEKAIAYSLCWANISEDWKTIKINIWRFRRCVVWRNGVVITFLWIPHNRTVKKNNAKLHKRKPAKLWDLLEFFEEVYLKQKWVPESKKIKSNILFSHK